MSDNRTVHPADLALFRRDFEHEDQVRLCARHLEVMREEWVPSGGHGLW